MFARPLGIALTLLTAALLPVWSCGDLEFVWSKEKKGSADLGVPASDDGNANSAATRDTIGAVTYYDGLRKMRVRGYGLVYGLGKSGSRDCPKHIYDNLVQSMYKEHRFTSSEIGTKSKTPEQLINSLGTAVVVVYGDIRAGAVKGTRFDVVVRALRGTQTQSLRGGRLLPMDLEIFRDMPSGRSLSGKRLARAAGPVFVNPFGRGDAATKANPLEGTILGGGINIEDRRLRLVLLSPSYGVARRVQDRINARFPARPKVADAMSPSFIRIVVPQEFRRDVGHFLGLVRRLCLPRDPTFVTKRAHLLAREIAHPKSPHAEIALCFEGLGRPALPVLQDLYPDTKAYVSFHAAAAGLRLGDHLACDTIALHAKDPASPFRMNAIRAAGEARGMACAAMMLRNLLNDNDVRIQTAAYEALVDRGDTAIESIPVGQGNFVLDLIPTDRPNFVYAKRSGQRRIALFGKGLRCSQPLFYAAPDDSVTMSAQPGEESLTVVRRVAASGKTSPPVPGPFDLAKLIVLLGRRAQVGSSDEVLGFGLDYGPIVRAVFHLCQDGSVNATFVLEQPNIGELFGPPKPAGRPESDL